jgi:hypothetical protein
MGETSHNGTKNVKTNNCTIRPTRTPLKPGGLGGEGGGGGLILV